MGNNTWGRHRSDIESSFAFSRVLELCISFEIRERERELEDVLRAGVSRAFFSSRKELCIFSLSNRDSLYLDNRDFSSLSRERTPDRWRLARSGELAFRDERHAAELGKLALPALNKFVPSSLHVLPQTGRGCYRVPREAFEALEDDESLTLWRRADYGDAAASVRRVPKSFANALLRSADSPHAHQDARSIVLCKCFCALVSSRLNHESYDAALAGLSVSLDAGRTSLAVRCSGFSDNLPVLWARALDKLAADASCYSQTDTGETSDDDDAREAAAEFERERAALARRCDDAQRDEPATRVAQWADFVLEEELEPVSAHSLRAAIREESRDAAADSLKRAALDVLQRVAHARLEVYVAGNADDATANQLATAVRTARTHARRACAALPVVARAADDDAVVQAADVVTVAGVTTPRCLVLPVGDGEKAASFFHIRCEIWSCASFGTYRKEQSETGFSLSLSLSYTIVSK